jgi:flagellar hook protein FlgE
MANYTISLSGLQSTSKALDTVSNNIANSNTVGYKAGDYLFADQFIKAINPADQSRVGLGVQNTMVRRSNIQGTIVASANMLDMAINGQGMFRLLQSSGVPGSVDPSAVFYTRNGQFMVDKEGYIVNANGMYLTGFQPTANKEGISDDIIANNGLLRLPGEYLAGRPTTASTITALLDTRTDAYTPDTGVFFDPLNSASYNNKTTQTVFDDEGGAHTLELYYRRIGDSNLQILATDRGYIYSPSPSRTANLATSESLTDDGRRVVLNRDSILRVETEPLFKELAEVATVAPSTQIVLKTLPDGEVFEGMRVYINGVDSGLFVEVVDLATKTVTVSDAINLSANAEVSFYPPYRDAGTLGAAASIGDSQLLVTALPGELIGVSGYRVFVNGVDTGTNVTNVAADPPPGTGSIISLDGGIPLDVALGSNVEFRPVQNMTLITPDGTRISVKGTTNQRNSPEETILYANMATVMVYGSLNGRFFNYDQGVTTNPDKAFLESTLIGVPDAYRAIFELNFVGGRNIDALVTDTRSGSPLFRTTNNLYAELTNQAGGSVFLNMELDMTDTTLQAGAFQITRNIQNGEPLSRLTNVSIDTQGRIVATYGTGKQLYVGQVALVHFNAFEGLIPVGNNTFAASIQSGTEQSTYGVLVGKAGTGIFGDIKSQALESSNVDLANELVRLLILQRSYTANSQGLRAFDSTLQDTLRIIG